jgi:hypothetical protein
MKVPLLRQCRLFRLLQGRYACSLCGKRFPQRGELRNHEQQHGSDRPFTCHTCGKSFARDAYLRIHMKTHARKSKERRTGGAIAGQKVAATAGRVNKAVRANKASRATFPERLVGQVVVVEAAPENNLAWSNPFMI